jgi:hypothetical protein
MYVMLSLDPVHAARTCEGIVSIQLSTANPAAISRRAAERQGKRTWAGAQAGNQTRTHGSHFGGGSIACQSQPTLKFRVKFGPGLDLVP